MNILKIGFEDFKKLAINNNRRIYYYQIDNILELLYMSEGVFVKTFVDLNLIDNRTAFFGQQLFMGAIKLTFKVPDGYDVIGISDAIPSIGIVDVNMTEEQKNIDIQKEGVGEEE